MEGIVIKARDKALAEWGSQGGLHIKCALGLREKTSTLCPKGETF